MADKEELTGLDLAKKLIADQEAESNKELVKPLEFENEINLDTGEPKTGLVRPLEFKVKTKSIEEKTYIILFYLCDQEEDEYNQVFQICTGRTDTYRLIEDYLKRYQVDIYKSIIITETKQKELESGDEKYYLLPLGDCKNIYDFCKSVEFYYGSTAFDIEEYATSDAEDTTINPDQVLTREMEDMMHLFEDAVRNVETSGAIMNMFGGNIKP